MTWMGTLSGARLELLHPRVEQVNFRDMTTALSRINRYNGHASSTISVAQHLIIGCENAPEEIRPWWLLHDAHEERIGDVTSPMKTTTLALAEEMFGLAAASFHADVRREFERRHDTVIHQAAKLPLPTSAQIELIKKIDLAALVTEKRDFLATQECQWSGLRHIEPFKRRYRPMRADQAAEKLWHLFIQYLPALSGQV